MKNKTTIYVVRHSNVKYNGDINDKFIHLTGEGWNKATLLSKKIPESFDQIYSSPLQRCVETIVPISLDQNVNYQIIEELTELNYNGNAQNFHIQILTEPNFYYEGGETLYQADTRFRKVLINLAGENQGKTILISTHGTVFSQFLINEFNQDKNIFSELKYPDVYKFDYEQGEKLFKNLIRINLN